jgi:hypothetical protein
VAKIAFPTAIILFFVAVRASGVLNEPFPQGCSMGNLGTIIYDDGPGSREPLQNAATLKCDTLSAGIAASVTTYYDDMDNYGDRHLASVSGGGWLTAGRFGCKAAVTNFDVLGVYGEQSGYFSCAINVFRGVRLGADLTGTRFILTSGAEAPLSLAQAGFSVRIPVKIIAFVASIDHLTVKPTHTDGAAPPLRISCSIHTMEHTYGAQGIRIDITPEFEHPVRLAIGEEFRFSRNFAIHGALANNPFFVGFGIAVLWNNACASAALVNHPVLGWSRGFGAQYGRNFPGRSQRAGNHTVPLRR